MSVAIKAFLIFLISVFAIHLVSAAPTEPSNSTGFPDQTKPSNSDGLLDPTKPTNSSEIIESSGDSEQNVDTESLLTNSSNVAINGSGKCDCEILPERFYGHYRLDHTINMDQRWSYHHNAHVNPNPANWTVTFERTDDPKKFTYTEVRYHFKPQTFNSIELGKVFGPKGSPHIFYMKNNKSVFMTKREFYIENEYLFMVMHSSLLLPPADTEKYVFKRVN